MTRNSLRVVLKATFEVISIFLSVIRLSVCLFFFSSLFMLRISDVDRSCAKDQ